MIYNDVREQEIVHTQCTKYNFCAVKKFSYEISSIFLERLLHFFVMIELHFVVIIVCDICHLICE